MTTPDSTNDAVREALREAIDKAGSQVALCAKLGDDVKTGHVFYWLKQGVVPERHCLIIEEEFGVSRKRLCPHWSRVWKELREPADPQPAGQGA